MVRWWWVTKISTHDPWYFWTVSEFIWIHPKITLLHAFFCYVLIYFNCQLFYLTYSNFILSCYFQGSPVNDVWKDGKDNVPRKDSAEYKAYKRKHFRGLEEDEFRSMEKVVLEAKQNWARKFHCSVSIAAFPQQSQRKKASPPGNHHAIQL